MASLVHLPVQPLGWGLVAVVMGLVSLLLFNSGRSSSCFACLFAFVGGAFVTTLNREYATGAPPADYMKYDAVVMSTPQRHGKVVGFDALVVDVADRRVSPFMAKVSIAGLDTCRLGIGSGIEALSVFTVPGQRKDSKLPVQRKTARGARTAIRLFPLSPDPRLQGADLRLCLRHEVEADLRHFHSRLASVAAASACFPSAPARAVQQRRCVGCQSRRDFSPHPW